MIATRRNEWLDLCRALAILLVILSHGRYLLRSAMPWADALRFGGFMGVELFFALSGFLIGGILIRLSRGGGAHWLSGFYARRWFRTLPNYYLFLLVNIAMVALGVYSADLGALWKYLLFVQNLFSPHPPFFAEAWSLALEEVFYLLFPLLLLMVSRLLGLPHSRSVLVAAVAVIALSLVARLLLANSIETWDAGIRKVVFLRCDTLMFGVLLAWVYDRHPSWLKKPGLAAGMTLLFAACLLYYGLATDAELNASFFAKTFYLSLVPIGCAGVVLIGIERRLPAWLAAVSGFLARISYSVYLVNLPVMLTLIHLFGCCASSPFRALGLWLAFMVLTLSISYALYEFYEKRFNALRDRHFPSRVSGVRATRRIGHA